MEELKTLFGDEAINYETFEKKLTEAGDKIKLANLATHEYVDRNIYETQKAKLEKGLEDYKSKYQQLAESTKGYDEMKNQFEELTAKYNELLTKQDTADKMKMIDEANVDSRFAEFVYSKVSPQVSEEKDFQTALGEFLKENGQYLNANRGTFVDLQNGNTAPKTVNQRMNDFIRGKGKNGF